MQWLWIALGILVGVPLLAALAGMLLPRDHLARMTIELRSPPERIWSLVSDFGSLPQWRPDVSAVTVDSSSAATVRFSEKSKHGTIPYEVVSQEPPRRQVVRIIDDRQPFGGTWTWDIEPLAAGTRVTITEAGFIKNPLFRVMSKLFFPPTATMRTYLSDLARALQERSAPSEVAVR